ncbi:acetyl-CoA carboxylase carboxyltransferase subunit alpha [Thermaurantiacus sp.]
MTAYLEFEGAVAALETSAARAAEAGNAAEAADLALRAERQLKDLYARLTPWQRTQVARHPARPHFPHYVAGLFTDFVPLAGDRRYGEDLAILGGPARFRGRPVMLIGHAKGEDTPSRLRHNFGMAKPEGYRKAVRLMEMADRFRLPIITLVDTPGAFPGIEAEERGQAEAIARATEACLAVRVPFVAIIVGEGGSGGAVALATANRVLMLEHSIYSVISPEGCASILWRSTGKGNSRAADAAEAMKVTAADLLRLGTIDRIVYEPVGGAHRDHATTMTRVATALGEELAALSARDGEALRAERRAKFRAMGRTPC